MSTTLTCTISGVSYPVKQGDGYGTFAAYGALEVRGSLDITIIDYAGTFSFVYGQPVVLSDSVKGTFFEGFVGTDKPTKLGPASTTIEHALACFDKQYLVDKRTNYSNYLNWYAGDVVVDFVQNVLSAEGITVAAAMRRETTVSDFSAGTLSGTVGTLDTNGDGCLELAKAGSDLTITEATTSDFASGTLTNVASSSNSLSPTTIKALKVVATLPFSQNPADLQVNIWSGSKALGTNDTLNFSMFVASSSPEIKFSVGLTFSDGSQATAINDQNGFAIDEETSLSTKASNQWYTRSISTSTYNGKTISNVFVAFGGVTSGIYTAYVSNIYLTSSTGSPFFSTTATATQLNPVTVQTAYGYAASSLITSVVDVVNPTAPTRISTAYSIDTVKLLRSSSITWDGDCSLYTSYNGGGTYTQCTNGAALPALPVGSSITGLTLTLKEVFDNIGSDPTAIPLLRNVSISLASAPNATKSDVVKSFATQADWNTGTYNGAVAQSNGDLTTGSISSGWKNNQINNQTFLTNGSSTQSISNGMYSVRTLINTSTPNKAGRARLDWAGTVTNFVMDIDIIIPNTVNYSSVGVVQYLQTYWPSALDTGTGAYTLWMQQSGINNNISLFSGTNSSTSTQTTIDKKTQNTPSHLRISVQGGHHQIYFDNNPTAIFDFTDNTYTSGQIAIGGFTYFQDPNGGGYSTVKFQNPVIFPATTETWTGPSTSISSLGTCDDSAITWAEVNTGDDAAVFVQSSIDGGTTYQTCTNGDAIPNLPAGTNVSGKSVKLLVSFYCNPTVVAYPILRQLSWRVLGAYPGSSGTRTTAPIGIDYIDRANQTNWGTASDGQAWAKTGTGTAAVASNKLTITNTTGDVFERLGSVTGSDLDETVDFTLSASTMAAGMALRYVDANNYYLLKVTTSTISIIKKVSGTPTTLATSSTSLSTGTLYWMRFRVVGTNPVSLYGNVWADGVLEPTIDSTTYQWNDNNWIITTED